VVSCGDVVVPRHIVAEAVFEAVGRAIESAVKSAAGQ
jgi:imidazoleglycerol phosphate dehydratase HisB